MQHANKQLVNSENGPEVSLLCPVFVCLDLPTVGGL